LSAVVEANHCRAGDLHLHWRWNDFAWPLVVLTDRDMFTVPFGLNLLRSEINPDWGNVMALALLSLLPMLAIFLAFQRYLIQGIASTGLK
jgi:alpha-1,4-digalacturonate transport system permease protein